MRHGLPEERGFPDKPQLKDFRFCGDNMRKEKSDLMPFRGITMVFSLRKQKIIQFSLITLIIVFFAIILIALCLHDGKIFPH